MRSAHPASIIAAVAMVAALTTPAVLDSGSAGAATFRVSVTASSSAGDISWATPPAVGGHARITNTAGGSGASTVITLDDSTAPTTYAFPLALPAGDTATAQSDGSVLISSATGPLGQFQPPWAVDAHGDALATHYTLTGSVVSGYVLTQHIDTAGATFPISADPHYTWGWITGTVYFNRSETRDIAYGAGGAAAVAAALAPPFSDIVAAMLGVFAAEAAIAENHHACLKVKSTGSFGFYTGGYCQ